VIRASACIAAIAVATACGATGERIDVEKAERAVDQAQKQVEGGLRTARDRVEDVGQDLGKAAEQVQSQVQTATADAVPISGDTEVADLVLGGPAAISCVEEACTVERAFADRMRAKPMALASQARVDPERRDGRTIGLRMSEVRELPHLFGFQDRDVVTSINGLALKSVQSIPQVVLQLRSANRFVVEYERGSDRSSKVITIE
jgi:type II secretory pathway component PulC